MDRANNSTSTKAIRLYGVTKRVNLLSFQSPTGGTARRKLMRHLRFRTLRTHIPTFSRNYSRKGNH